MLKKHLILVIMFCFIFSPLAFAEPNYQEGRWEITTTMDIPGMPKALQKPHTYTTCLTKHDMVPQPKEQNDQQCKITDQKIKGNTVTWTMTCKGGTVSTGKITYTKKSFKGSQKTTTEQGGQKMTFKASVTGKYLGPCKK